MLYLYYLTVEVLFLSPILFFKYQIIYLQLITKKLYNIYIFFVYKCKRLKLFRIKFISIRIFQNRKNNLSKYFPNTTPFFKKKIQYYYSKYVNYLLIYRNKMSNLLKLIPHILKNPFLFNPLKLHLLFHFKTCLDAKNNVHLFLIS